MCFLTIFLLIYIFMNTQTMSKYPVYTEQDFVKVNRDILEFWSENHIFERSVSEREGAKSFVFYEGPPSANGQPGIHHVLARAIKDIFCRYKTLKGFNVLSRATEELPDILAEHGIIYHADYFHDDQPTPINVTQGKLVSIPYGAELNDSVMTSRNRPWESDTLFEMVKDAFDRLYAEGADNGMVLCLPLHPWCSGYPYRIRHLERILDYVMGHDGVWQTASILWPSGSRTMAA